MGKIRGKFIVIEGTDGSGKNTQKNELVKNLNARSIECVGMSFPVYDSPTGNIIKRYLGKDGYKQEFGASNLVNPKVASVFYAFDRFVHAPEINNFIQDGKVVITDRWVESNMGHQGGKITNSEDRAKFYSWGEDIEYTTFNLPKPDSVIFLYRPFEVGRELRLKRGEGDGHEDSAEHIQNAERAYLELAERYKWQKVDCAPKGVMRSVGDIAKELEFIALHILSR